MPHCIATLEIERTEAERQHCERVAQQHPNGWLPEEVAELLARERQDAYERGYLNGHWLDVILLEAEDGTWIAIPNPVTQIPLVRAANKELAQQAIVQLSELRWTTAAQIQGLEALEDEFRALMEHTEFEGGEDQMLWNGLDRAAAENAGAILPTAEQIPLTSQQDIEEQDGDHESQQAV